MLKAPCALVAAVFCLATVPAQAATLGVPSSLITVVSSDVDQFSKLDYTTGKPLSRRIGNTENYSYAETTFFGGPKASANVVQITPPVRSSALGDQFASSSIMYVFEVTGPQSVKVPINIIGYLFAEAEATSGSTFADASFYISSPDNSLGRQAICAATDSLNCAGRTPAPLGRYGFNEQVYIPANERRVAVLSAMAGAGDNHTTTTGRASAWADPYIQIDPSFLAANPGYSLEFSSGIDNVPISPVPLPAALPLFGSAALGLLAFAKRREKANLAAT